MHPPAKSPAFDPDRQLRCRRVLAKAWRGMRTSRFPSPQAPGRDKRFSVAGASLLETKISLKVYSGPTAFTTKKGLVRPKMYPWISSGFH